MTRLAALFLCLALVGAAQAQPVPRAGDSVTVTGERSRAAIERYLGEVTTHTVIAGKIARWERNQVCPIAAGLRPAYLAFITARIRAVGAEVGAPVNSKPDCQPNIRIVFTTAPQALLDNIRKHHSGLLGYANSNHQADRMAEVIHPVQAWYSTETIDWNGNRKRDVRVIGMCADVLSVDCPNAFKSSPFRTGSGLRSGFENVTIVADPTRLGEAQMGVLADLIAMLALSQPLLGTGCQNSVLDLIGKDCANPPGGLSVLDMGFLRSLYHMRSLAVGMRNPIAAQMEKDLNRPGAGK